MLIPAAVAARAGHLLWPPIPFPLFSACSDPPVDPGPRELRVPAMERVPGDPGELVVALVAGPGLSPTTEVCVETMLRHLKRVWAVVTPVALRHVRFRHLWVESPEELAPFLPAADLFWLQLPEGSERLGTPLAAWVPPGVPRAMIGLVRRDMLMLNPDPTQTLRAWDALVLRGAR